MTVPMKDADGTVYEAPDEATAARWEVSGMARVTGREPERATPTQATPAQAAPAHAAQPSATPQSERPRPQPQ